MVSVLIFAVVVFFISVIPYIVYLFGIHFGRKSPDIRFPEEYPRITVIMSAYNEEAVVGERIENLKQCHYPREFYEVIFIDDFSNDRTLERAKASLETAGINHTIIANTERLGTNRSYNHAMKLAHTLSS